MEDYKQKYEEALKRAKGAHNSAKSDKENGDTDKITEYTIQLTETIFPELKESEGERIRKGLIQHLEILRGWTPGDPSPIKVKEHYDAWLAWLEKQGEQKPIDEQSDTCDTCENGELYEGKPNDYTKSNEEKAKEICMAIEPPYIDFIHQNYKTAIQAMEWKDEQFKAEKQALIEKACEWLRNVTYFDYGACMFEYGRFIKDFKKAMEEK